jgi:hypothetical protein
VGKISQQRHKEREEKTMCKGNLSGNGWRFSFEVEFEVEVNDHNSVYLFPISDAQPAQRPVI